MKTCVCAIAKMENHYIREWVEHYKRLGFSLIVVFDNNDEDGEHLGDAIGDYMESGYVIVVDARGKKHYQGEAYLTFYKGLNADFDWIAFFDVDEYLVLDPKYSSITDFLNDEIFSDADVIRVSWRMMSDSGHVRVENGDYSLVKRFTEPVKNGLMWNKAIVRGGIDNFSFDIKDSEASPHLIKCSGVKNAVNCKGEHLSNNSIKIGATHENARLDHYSCKTIEEFVTNKIKKGWAVTLNESLLAKNMFFGQNEWTQEKEDVYNELIGQGNEIHNAK